MSFFTLLWEGIKATSIIEWLAVLSSLTYVVLAAKRMLICWWFAFIGSSLFVYLCYVGHLYIESILQLFYVVMAVVGWFSWKLSKADDVEIKTWSFKNHVLNIVVSGFVALLLGFIFDHYTLQANPYVDAFTTCYSLSATFMVTRKIMGNWIYWIVIDLVSIYLYTQQDYYLTAVQYGIFTLLAIYGFMAWKKEYKRQLS
ncbi:MAG: nicotinamide riboside transporter PnuC [Flavobacteriales bacterium]|nr:nicotinamide riboside transporter PnuC [Flavobacteriales bacterium]